MVETTYDLRYNIAALTLAICSEVFMLPEAAFSTLEDSKFKIGNSDTEDMLALREQGVTYRDIAEIYDSTGSNIYHRLKRYKKKKTSQTAI